jgi:hypothetical protein
VIDLEIAMRKPVLKYEPEALKGKRHFFASSLGEWRVDDNLPDLIEKMKRGGMDFNLYCVPGPRDSEYQISNYAPVAEGVVFLGYWGF